jgi:ABC-type Fe3+ transport system substrate-binding protein
LAQARDAGETELKVSWGSTSLGGYEGAARFEALFNQMYGTNIKINLTPGPSMPDMMGKIAQELAAGRKASSDILLANETNFAQLYPREVLEPYDYTLLSPRILPEIVAPGNTGVEVYSSLPAIVYNSELVPAAQVPQKLTEALDPRWKGKIATTPYASPLDRVAQRPEWGNEAMKTFVARLAEQAGGLIRASEGNRIVTGEFHMFVLSNTHSGRSAQRRGEPIGFVLPPDAAVAGFLLLGVPRNAEHPHLAKLFINTVVSEGGQRILWDTYAADHHLLPGTQTEPEILELKAKGSTILDVHSKLVLERPEMLQLSADLDRILETSAR